MGVYEKFILPRLIDFACGMSPVDKQREKVVPRAQGVVLEPGMGTGLNLAFYDAAKVEKVIGVDPSPEGFKTAKKRAKGMPIALEFLELKGEEIPLAAASVDNVLLTYTLCTIPDPHTALLQMRRVLKPGGTLIFCEHGAAPDEGVRRWQDRINPIWRRIAGGCNLNRDVPGLLNAAGFHIDEQETMYLPKTPRFAGFNYWGTARTA